MVSPSELFPCLRLAGIGLKTAMRGDSRVRFGQAQRPKCRMDGISRVQSIFPNPYDDRRPRNGRPETQRATEPAEHNEVRRFLCVSVSLWPTSSVSPSALCRDFYQENRNDTCVIRMNPP